MRKFDAMHSVTVRSPYELRTMGQPDKPYVIEWDFPKVFKGRVFGVQRRHQLATALGAEAFAIKHQIPLDRLPVVLRRRLCDLARTVKAIRSTSSAP